MAPGFVDILANIALDEGLRLDRSAHEFKIGDGVTSVLGMHGGPLDVADYGRKHAAVGPKVNYAATVGHSALREAVGATDRYLRATPEQIEAMRPLAVQAIRDGAVGIGFGINYTPGASYEEIFALFEVAAAEGVPCHLHARYKGNVFPLTMSLAAMEVISMAAATGAQAQLAHLISSTVGSAPLSIALIEGAAARGVDVGFDFPRLDTERDLAAVGNIRRGMAGAVRRCDLFRYLRCRHSGATDGGALLRAQGAARS